MKISSDGQFLIPAMASGHLTLETNLPDDVPFGIRLSQIPAANEPDAELKLALHATPRVTVRGTLLDDSGNPLTSRTVLHIEDGLGHTGQTLIFNDGIFTKSVLSCDVRFCIEKLLDQRPGTWKQLNGLPFTVA